MRILAALALLGCKPDEIPPDSCSPEPELCDGVDNDCDGVIDEGVGERWFRDADGDGVGDPNVPLLTCDEPDGYVAIAGDCDDTDPMILPGATEQCNDLDDDCNGLVDDDAIDPVPLFVDGDGDGFGDTATEVLGCPSDPDRVTEGGDCDDDDPAIGAAVPVWEDLDGDGFGGGAPLSGCEPEATQVLNGDDCNDDDPTVSPGVSEIPASGIDEDCDGEEECFEDLDGDGSGSGSIVPSLDLFCETAGVSASTGDCDDTNPDVNPLIAEVCANGIDDDCDPATLDLFDNDGDGLTCDEDCDDGMAPSAAVQFDEIAVSRGLNLPLGMGPFPCGADVMGGAAAVADFDNDGDHDIFLPRMYLPDQLFMNNGAGFFEEVSIQRGIDHEGSSNGAVWLDIEDDGDLDLFVVSVGLEEGNRLYLNTGSTFIEVSAERGVSFPPGQLTCSFTFSVSAADVDGDGDLDLHQTAWEPDVFAGNDRSRIWLNDGNGFFTPSTALDLSGLASFTSVWADFDSDGDLDVGVASDWGRSTLWRNDGGLVFEDVTVSANVGTDENGMGSAVADADGDGDLDWFVTAIYDDADPCPAGWGCTGNRLFLGLDDLTFFDATDRGVRDGAWSWGAAFFDYDNDGDLDLGVENGFPNGGFHRDHTRLFENDGSAFFTDRACETGLARNGQGRSLVPLDIERDGAIDLLMMHQEEPVRLFSNTGTTPSLTIRLLQPAPNRHAVGATVWLRTQSSSPEIRRDVHLNSQYGATAPAEAHFGLGTHIGPTDRVRIVWPDGAEQFETGLLEGVVTIARTVP